MAEDAPEREAIAPYDQRLARLLIRPLVGTRIRPNHLTTLSLLLGVTAALTFAFGAIGNGVEHAGALLYMLAVFTDHTDGEFARLSGQTSEFGHVYDYLVGSANYTLLFLGLGVGLAASEGEWMLALGLIAGLANPLIVTLRMKSERRHGKAAVAHPSGGGFEIEDFIYLIGPITWLGGLRYFFLVYGIGTLGYLAWTTWTFGRAERARKRAGC